MYKYFKKRFNSFSNQKQKPASFPKIKMFLRKEGIEYEILYDKLNEKIALTNKSRNVATINVEFTEFEYKLYIDQLLAVKDNDFDLISDIKPKNYTDLYDCLRLYTAAEVLDDVVW